MISLQETNRRRGNISLLEYIRRSKTPPVFTVVLEDISDIAGQAIALVAIYLSVKLHNPIFDGIGSIGVGLVVLAVAVLLANESRGLLVGETAPSKDVARMKLLLQSDPSVERVGDVLDHAIGP